MLYFPQPLDKKSEVEEIMFENWTEKARRVLWYARYEAVNASQRTIHSEHLLVGLAREDPQLMSRFPSVPKWIDVQRQVISKGQAQETPLANTPHAVDMPLSDESKRILAYASDESKRMGSKDFRAQDLLLGMLREEKSLAAEMLRQWGVTLAGAREKLKQFVRA
jgi:ATP-dependent Clp protease ATP-binding subunit ClpC